MSLVDCRQSIVDFETVSCWQVEEHYGKKTPFDSVYKLEHTVRKSDRDASRIMWSLIGIVDCCLNQKVLPQEITVTALTGKGKGNKGYHYPNLAEANRTSFGRHVLDTC